MSFFLNLEQIDETLRDKVGGKAYALSQLNKAGIEVPKTVVITNDLYRIYIERTRIKQKIPFLLGKKALHQMRWEEIWDLSIKIRNLFLNTSLPRDLKEELVSQIGQNIGTQNLAIRSSSTLEDSAEHSFAGLHESFINITGISNITKHIKLVWASLWSNGAIMYRKELGLSVETSLMAVLLQEVVAGEVSGLIFGKDPRGINQIVLEAIYGFNQALVDDAVEPDRWFISRSTGDIIKYLPASRDKFLIQSEKGLKFQELSPIQRENPPLQDSQVKQLIKIAQRSEELFSAPQDMEWTYKNGEFVILQSRPITTIKKDEKGYQKKDQREWYLSLVRSFEDLTKLKDKIEKEYFPAMDAAAKSLSDSNLQTFSDEELSREIISRWDLYKKWKDIYWDEFIPLAHGSRLFGKVYNDYVSPENPYEYVNLLKGTDMISLRRNNSLARIAQEVSKEPILIDKIKRNNISDPRLSQIISNIKEEVIAYSVDLTEKDVPQLLSLIVKMIDSQSISQKENKIDFELLRENFLSHVPEDERSFALEVLELGRASYRLRDDDNIYLGQIEKKYLSVLNEGIRRLSERGMKNPTYIERKEVVKSLRNKNYEPEYLPQKEGASEIFDIKARQMVGQATSPGLAKGKARIIKGEKDIFQFQKNEILVCDSIEPNMTFVVPLAAGIVERRGGMLVHGAIIAREYGIPCVTGIPNATDFIRTGDTIAIDGYLGIVVINKQS